MSCDDELYGKFAILLRNALGPADEVPGVLTGEQWDGLHLPKMINDE